MSFITVNKTFSISFCDQGTNQTPFKQEEETTGESVEVGRVGLRLELGNLNSGGLPLHTLLIHSLASSWEQGRRNIPQVWVVEFSHSVCNTPAQGTSLAQNKAFSVRKYSLLLNE